MGRTASKNYLKNKRGLRDGDGSWQSYSLLAGLMVLVFCLSVYMFSKEKTMINVYAPWEDASMEIRLELVLTHLEFEEYVSGNRGHDVRDIRKRIDTAKRYAEALLNGGEIGAGEVVPLKSEALRRDIQELKESINRFGSYLTLGFSKGETFKDGINAGKEYHEVFDEIILLAQEFERALYDEIELDIKNYARTQQVLRGFILVLFFLVGFVFYRHEKQVREYLKNIEESRSQIEKSNRFVQTIMDSMGDAVIVTDQKGFLTYINPVAVDLTKWSVAEAKDQPIDKIFNIINEYTRQPVKSPVVKVIRHKKIFGLANHTLLIAKDGTELPIADSGAPILDEEGRFSGVVLVFRDVTDMREAERSLQESKDMLEGVFRCVGDAIRVVDLDCNVIAINNELEVMTGMVSKDLVNRKCSEMLCGEECFTGRCTLNRILQGEQRIQKETTKRTPDGADIVVDLVATPLKRKDKVVGMIESLRDITYRKRQEEVMETLVMKSAARTGKEFLDEMVERLCKIIRADCVFFGQIEDDVGVAVQTISVFDEGRMAKNFKYDIKGTPCEKVIGKGTCIYPSGVSRLFPKDELLKDKGVEGYLGVPLVDQKGQPLGIMVGLFGRPIHDNEVVLIEQIMQVVATRVSAGLSRMRDEEERSRLISILEASLDFISVANCELKIEYLNKAGRRMLGYGEEEDLGKRKIKEDYPPAAFDQILNEGIPTAVKEGYWEGETTLLHKDGTEIPVAQVIISHKGEDGEVEFLSTVIRDITEQKRYEEELLKKNKELEAFVYSISHDLKTPLVAIQGFAGLLLKNKDNKLSAKGQDFISRISKNIENMGNLINDLLTLSRVGRVIGEKEYVVVKDLFEETRLRLAEQIKEYNIEFTIDEKSGCQILCDRKQMLQAFENLVTNAIKFIGRRNGGKIEMACECASRSQVVIFVADNGIGIDPKYHDKIFDIFHRLEDTGRKIEGTGIGLSLVKRIIEEHGGRIRVESQKGQGAKFLMNIPRKVNGA